jgi:hypothetical protein
MALLQAVRDAWDDGDTTEVQRLIDEDGADPAEKGVHGASALLEAARWGHAATIALLLARGAQVDGADDEGRTPLYVAASVGHEEAAGVLLSHGAQVDCCTLTTRWTALHAAADRGHTATVTRLLKSGAAVHPLCATGQTPRDLAREKRHRSTVLIFDGLANTVLSLVGARQRLAWALVAGAGTDQQIIVALPPDLVWSVGSLLASCPSWMQTSTQLRAEVGRRATIEDERSTSACQSSDDDDSSCCTSATTRSSARASGGASGMTMSNSSTAILAAEVARVERATRVGSFQRRPPAKR